MMHASVLKLASGDDAPMFLWFGPSLQSYASFLINTGSMNVFVNCCMFSTRLLPKDHCDGTLAQLTIGSRTDAAALVELRPTNRLAYVAD